MKADKSLNKNHTTALYAMTGSIPDKGLLHEFVSIHQAHMLDTLDGWSNSYLFSKIMNFTINNLKRNHQLSFFIEALIINQKDKER